MTQDRPDAPGLLDAVAEYLVTEARGAVPRQERFRVLVAANVCAVVARELRAGEEPLREDLELFGRILGEDTPSAAGASELSAGVRYSQRRLAAALRTGTMDARLDEVAELLRAHVSRKLAVGRPGYDGGG